LHRGIQYRSWEYQDDGEKMVIGQNGGNFEEGPGLRRGGSVIHPGMDGPLRFGAEHTRERERERER
jgi:hypothetical protein